MPIVPISQKGCRVEKGSALVIVLFFVVLLSIVTIAFLSRSLVAIKVSAGSAGETKSKILASSASDIILGDLKQEIIAGSNPNSGTVNFPVYTPMANQSMIPFQSGVPITSSTNAIPNLISRSVSPANTGGAAPYVPYPAASYSSTLIPANRAASDSTAAGVYTSSKVNSATPSLNGRYVSPAQWNEHFLIPRNAPGSGTDSTPVSSFVPPDWVIVTRGGVNSVSWTSPGGLNDPTLSNTNCAVGRYAYAIYNEGGLLDMNAAGYPGTDATSGSVGLTPTQIGMKNSLALADLTQLTVGTSSLTQAQINNIVGWRNYASVEPPTLGGTFGSFTFTSVNAVNWLNNFVLGNTNGYMQIVPPASGVTTPPTDQVFLSRQQLISVIQSLGINSDFLQYMGTFSRALEQPSYVPNPNLPSIVGTALPPPPPAPSVTTFNTYQGNNTYFQGESAINMRGAAGFLGVRAKSTFTRLDGTSAIIGEPLVKRKFALSRLALVTTNYAPTFSSASAAAAANDPVYQRFGIYRSSTSSPWVYDHGIAAGGTASSSSTPAIIGTLNYVAALTGSAGTPSAPREPDLAELLKAAINAGSVGKAGPSGTGANDQYREDVSGDVQILKIMADLIDQQKTDNYPTWIQYNQTFSGITIPRNIYGDQDLPYFYRWNYYDFASSLPSPATDILSSADTVMDAAGSTLNHTRLSGASPLTGTGTATYMMIPQVWNPHDANTPQASGGGPTQFRIVVNTNVPGGSATTAWQITTFPGNNVDALNTILHFDGAPSGDESADCPTSALVGFTSTLTMNAANGSILQFTDLSAGKAFREPTLLWRNNFPAGVTLSGTSATDTLTGNTYFGIPVGTAPISWSWTDTNGKSYFSQTSTLNQGANAGPSGALVGFFDVQMQYKDASGNWITYQEPFVEGILRDITWYGLFVNKNEPAFSTSNAWENPFASPGINGGSPPFERQQSGLCDPRSNRFSAPADGQYASDDPILNGNPTLDATAMVANQTTSAINPAVATSNFVLMKTNRPTAARGQSWNYTSPCRGYDANEHWYSGASTTVSSNFTPACANYFDGLLSQNNPLLKVWSSGTTTAVSYYYEDPDGIARRAMGGYVPPNSGTLSSAVPCQTTSTYTMTTGLPEVTAGSIFTSGIETPTTQSQSRPILLHRPFQSVAEMSYAFRGGPWKNIDFFTPESGDSALLDVFCVNEPPSTAMVAGKVDLNTRQVPVLKALFSSAYRDQLANVTSPPAGALPALSTSEAGNLASTLVGITTSQNAWEGPLANVADIVGHFVYPDPGALTATDVYQYTSPANNTEYTFSGFSAALGGNAPNGNPIWDSGNVPSTQYIQRFRESAIRPLAAAGQTRVWNLLVDIIAQSGHYPKAATGLDQFIVDGQSHLWVHVAIDRYTGQVIDKQVEMVTP